MIDFKRLPYEWQNEMNEAFQNVNLNEIEMRQNCMTFKFLNSSNGDYLGSIQCKGVWKILIESDETLDFPVFICDVHFKELERAEILQAFDYMKFGFEVPKSADCFLLCLESGEFISFILCEKIEVKRAT